MSTGKIDPAFALVGDRIIRHTYGENGHGRYWNSRGELLRAVLEADIVALVRDVAEHGIPEPPADPEALARLEEFAKDPAHDVLLRDAGKPAGWGHQ